MDRVREQVKELRKLAGRYETPPYGREVYGTAELLKQAADTIEALSSKLAAADKGRTIGDCGNRWIACEDRLPERRAGTTYLVCLKNGCIFHAICLPSNKFMEISTMGAREFCSDNPVVAWQPLPEPYHP